MISVLVFLAVVLILTTVAVPLARRQLSRDVERQRQRMIVLRILAVPRPFVEAAAKLGEAMRRMAAAGRASEQATRILAEAVRKVGG